MSSRVVRVAEPADLVRAWQAVNSQLRPTPVDTGGEPVLKLESVDDLVTVTEAEIRAGLRYLVAERIVVIVSGAALSAP